MNVTKVGFGSIAFWTLPEYTERAKVKSALLALNEDFAELVPGPRPPSAVLKEAMQSVFAGKNTLIRPLKSRNGFTAVKEARGDNDNEYVGEFTAKVDEVNETLIFSSIDGRKDEVEKAYAAQKGMMSNNELTALLLDILSSKMKGIPLRPRGGIYWIPGAMSKDWLSIKEALQTVDSSINIYHLEHDVGPEYLRSVKDAIEHDVNSEAASLSEEIMGPKQLGKRALISKKKQANALREKIALYENILSMNLTNLRSKVDGVDTLADEATILIAGTPEGE